MKSYRRRELSWGGWAGSDCNLRPQEMEWKKSSGIMCRVTMKEWSHAIIGNTKPTVNPGCMTLIGGGFVYLLVHSQDSSVLESGMYAVWILFHSNSKPEPHITFPTFTDSFLFKRGTFAYSTRPDFLGASVLCMRLWLKTLRYYCWSFSCQNVGLCQENIVSGSCWASDNPI